MKETNSYTNTQHTSETSRTQSAQSKSHPAKRVDIVSLRMVKETSLLYKNRSIKSPEDGFHLFKQFLGELDREYFVVMCVSM